MARIVVLGGCGGIGSVASRALAAAGEDVVVADLDQQRAGELADEIGADSMACDASSAQSLRLAMNGADVVVNCVGPFYRFGPPILAAAIDAGVDYVDVCDDLAPTRLMLDLDATARAAGVTALLGMGNSPGIANVFVRLCAEQLLDEVETVDIMHVHGGEPEEGAGVLKHRIHAMVNPVPLYVDGEFREVRQLEADGQAFVREFDFRDVGRMPVFPYPHPETITLPRHFPGLRRATNLGVIFPLPYFERTQDLVRVGACSDEPLSVGGVEVTPLDVSVALLQRQRPTFLQAAGVTGPAGCLAVEVGGRKGSERHRYVFQLSSRAAGAGEGTGIPAAVGALLMAGGKVAGPGVVPPEAGVRPMDFLPLAFDLMARLNVSAGGESGIVHLEHVGPDGSRDVIPLGL
ncbi:MAG: SDR family NAD(P)-dependent oxidoreductase [Actinobacteria bacterium]|nr:SDR family NAD(P)-dependent oxidoreductase [Actinomycetota bacterium]MCB8996638.1 SDR family NAD(P)-dependent oxidoreductase [Actinomycetota bacterium]HRY10803.1 SDR family NAD(P)-dependent oxidoreductase [Candidatus Nanopelagicales bacterium]